MALTVIKPSGIGFSLGTIPTANIATLTATNVSVAGSLFQSNLPLVLNDISGQFDGQDTVFTLMLDQTSINTITDSKDLEVVINGLRLRPYVKEQRLPWITEYDSGQGYRVSGANLIIYNAPSPGDQCTLTVRSTSGTTQVRKYPYTAGTIALGD